MPLDFPSNPGIGDTYGFSDRLWTYSGEGWNLTPQELPQGAQGLQGAQGISGFFAGQGTQGTQGKQGPQGIKGIQGTQGIQGIQGLDGAFAGQGVQGTQGASASGGGSGTFDIGISTSIYISVTSGIGTNTETNNNIFIGPGIGYSFPSTVGKEYVIESMHISNTFNNDLYLSARHDYNIANDTWKSVPISQRVVVPYQGSAELIIQPIVANPQDILRLQAFAGVGTAASGVDGGLDAFVVVSEKTDTNYVGVGTTVANANGTEVFTSITYPSVLQSIRLCNYSLSVDADASIAIYRGGTVGGITTTGVRRGYLVYNLTIPKNSVIEILDRPKYLSIDETIVAFSSPLNTVSITISGKYIVQ